VVEVISRYNSNMKKLFVSMGLIAAGAASLQAAYAPDASTMTASKVWSVSGTLRGFYDDNYITSSDAKSSAGFEVSPQFGLNMALQQTELGVRYTYGMYYYFDRNSDPIDQTHQFDLWVDHAFSERWQARLQDSFVVGQEPELVDPDGAVRRTEGNNFRNTASLSLNTIWTRLFSTQLGYRNTFLNYEESGATEPDILADPVGGATLAGLLNRMEHSISLDLQWGVAPNTMVFLGGAFSWVDYTGDEPIAPDFINGGFLHSDSRNSRSYFGYVGVERSMLANLSFNGRIGVQYTDNYNDPTGTTSLNPYADLSLIYTYLPGCYAQFGFSQTQTATDQLGYDASNGHYTLNSDSSTLYASLNHKLTPKLMSTAIGRYQHSVYNGGTLDNRANDYLNFGLNLSYSFNPHWSAEAGYNFDTNQSDAAGTDYTRNRIYLGVTAAY
jgi:hypothetical protein